MCATAGIKLRPYDLLRRTLLHISNVRGLPLMRPHLLRHACATHMLDHGCPWI